MEPELYILVDENGDYVVVERKRIIEPEPKATLNEEAVMAPLVSRPEGMTRQEMIEETMDRR